MASLRGRDISMFCGVLWVLGGLAATGCAGRYPSSGGPGGAAASPAMKGSLENAALPYHVLDARTGRQLDEPAFWPKLAQARAVCIGEEHPNPHHHWVQLHVVRRLVKELGGAPLAVGLEMIQRPFQGVLDDYASRRIDAAALQSRSGWEERWGYDFGFYGPTLDVARDAGAALLALNTARELTKKVSRQGLEALTPDERAQLPELKLDDARHRAWFDALMSELGGAHGHGHAHGQQQEADPHAAEAPEEKPAPPASPSPHAGGGAPAMPSAERIYTVQVLWDETMADAGAKWLAANPRGRLVILAGNGHCHDSAIVARLERRGVGDVVSVRPVIDREGNVAEALARPMNDYVIALQMPK